MPDPNDEFGVGWQVPDPDRPAGADDRRGDGAGGPEEPADGVEGPGDGGGAQGEPGGPADEAEGADDEIEAGVGDKTSANCLSAFANASFSVLCSLFPLRSSAWKSSLSCFCLASRLTWNSSRSSCRC